MRLEFGTTTLLALAWLSNPALCDSHSQPPAAAEVCESRTINYITHTLPQQCLRTSWTSTPATVATTTTGETPSATATTGTGSPAEDKDPAKPVADQNEQEQQPEEKTPEQQAAEDKEAREEQEDLATSSFMSFEEWKEMMLRKSGQDPAQIKGQEKPHKEHRGNRDAGDNQGGLDSLGDDGEINIDFDALADKVSELTAGNPPSSAPQPSAEAREDNQVLLDDGKMQYYRSKDAGKTCKERFSYSSFDAGGLVLKTSPGAKNARSILVENKDSYMLLECHTKNKFVIVELSDDILVDTVVLANFEFFSSMIRKFRVSVSDRYPVKLDKWIELGTFEARNSRDIQAFLIEHPQIYTKYIRIEFLTHYGNEYYCPVSLLRVHGTRMLDSWKEPDNSRDDEEPETIEGTPEEQAPETPQQETVPVSAPTEPSNATEEIPVPKPEVITSVSPVNFTEWQPSVVFDLFMDTCSSEPATTTISLTSVTTNAVSSEGNSSTSAATSASSGKTSTDVPSPASVAASSVSVSGESQPHSSSTSSSRWPNSSPPPVPSTDSAASSKTPAASPSGSKLPQQQQPSAKTNVTESVSPPPQPKVVSSSTASTKNKTTASTTASPKKQSTTSTGPSASPTVQEGFFKAVTKRLQHLETNTSLSLQYIEEQSRFLQEALQKMEKRQVSRVDAFLDSLNKTVFAELRNVRSQYDQIWQSTVIALESQREQSQRETVALSERLSLLADEVVFQKRMAILQSVLLLAALILVIFSRGYYNAPAVDYYSMASPFRTHNRNASLSAPALVESPIRSPQTDDMDPDSPEYSAGSPARTGSMRRTLSRSDSYQDKDLPLTPVSKSAASSIYSREPTPAINVEEVDTPFFQDLGVSGKYTTPPRKHLEDSLFSEDSEVPDSVEGTPMRGSEDSIRDRNGQADYMSGGVTLDKVHEQHQHEQQPQAKNLRWSAVSQLGGAKKPLPALPEDVPEEQDSSQ